MKKLLIATNNPGKLAEYRELLAGLPVRLTSPADEGIDLDVEESGSSFQENAVLKARAFAEISGLPTLADDSGLEVMALDGAPGIHTSRYAGSDASDADRYRKLLKNLAGVAWERRQARFRRPPCFRLPPRPRRALQAAIDALGIAFFLFLVVYGIRMTIDGTSQYAMIFGMTMVVPYASVPVSAGLTALQIFLVAIRSPVEPEMPEVLSI